MATHRHLVYAPDSERKVPYATFMVAVSSTHARILQMCIFWKICPYTFHSLASLVDCVHVYILLCSFFISFRSQALQEPLPTQPARINNRIQNSCNWQQNKKKNRRKSKRKYNFVFRMNLSKSTSLKENKLRCRACEREKNAFQCWRKISFSR